jgi:hypothetical protein
MPNLLVFGLLSAPHDIDHLEPMEARSAYLATQERATCEPIAGRAFASPAATAAEPTFRIALWYTCARAPSRIWLGGGPTRLGAPRDRGTSRSRGSRMPDGLTAPGRVGSSSSPMADRSLARTPTRNCTRDASRPSWIDRDLHRILSGSCGGDGLRDVLQRKSMRHEIAQADCAGVDQRRRMSEVGILIGK